MDRRPGGGNHLSGPPGQGCGSSGCCSTTHGSLTQRLRAGSATRAFFFWGLAYERCSKLAEVLGVFPNLHDLMISGTSGFGAADLRVLAAGCPQLRNLECYLQRCWDEEAISSALRLHTALTQLRVRGSTALRALLTAVAGLVRLRALHVGFCDDSSEFVMTAPLPHLLRLEALTVWKCPPRGSFEYLSNLTSLQVVSQLTCDAELYGLGALPLLRDLSLVLGPTVHVVDPKGSCCSSWPGSFSALTRLSLLVDDTSYGPVHVAKHEALLALPCLQVLQLMGKAYRFPCDVLSMVNLQRLKCDCTGSGWWAHVTPAMLPSLTHASFGQSPLDYSWPLLQGVRCLTLNDTRPVMRLPPDFAVNTQLRHLEITYDSYCLGRLDLVSLRVLARMPRLGHLRVCCCQKYDDGRRWPQDMREHLSALQNVLPALVECEGCW